MQINLPSFLFKLDFWNFVIALLALFLAIYSIWYTHKRDKYSIEITEHEFRRNPGRPFLIFFSVFNGSNAPITITDIKLFDIDHQPVKLLDYVPEPEYTTLFTSTMIDLATIPTKWDYQNPFTSAKTIPSESFLEFSYYLNPFPNPIIIEVTTNKKINWFSKTKSFTVKFSKLD